MLFSINILNKPISIDAQKDTDTPSPKNYV